MSEPAALSRLNHKPEILILIPNRSPLQEPLKALKGTPLSWEPPRRKPKPQQRQRPLRRCGLQQGPLPRQGAPPAPGTSGEVELIWVWGLGFRGLGVWGSSGLGVWGFGGLGV